MLDLTQINLWSAEDATIEQTADEIRVYLRSWRVRNTHTETRTDVSTGDQQTNLYRGFFGARLNNGGAFQFGAQQYGTTPPSQFGGEQRSGRHHRARRVGEAEVERRRVRNASRPAPRRDHRRIVVRRAGRLDSGDVVDSHRRVFPRRVRRSRHDKAWAQVMAVASQYVYTGFRIVTRRNSHDARRVGARDRVARHESVHGAVHRDRRERCRARFARASRREPSSPAARRSSPPSARASFTTERVSVSGYAEAKSADSIARADVTFRLQPLSFISLLGSVGPLDRTIAANGHAACTTTYLRGEAGLRASRAVAHRRRGAARQRSSRAGASSSTRAYIAQHAPGATGFEAAIRGKLWGPSAPTSMEFGGTTRPARIGRSIRRAPSCSCARTSLDRFPTNDFGLMASVVHEYRSDVHFPSLDLEPAVARHRVSGRFRRCSRFAC